MCYNPSGLQRSNFGLMNSVAIGLFSPAILQFTKYDQRKTIDTNQ